METLIELIIRAKNGDDAAFQMLCDKYNPLLASMAYKYAQKCAENGLNDDFLQEAKMALYSAVMSFDVNQDMVQFGFYLKRCIRNRLISCVRKFYSKKRQSNTAEEEVVGETPQESVIQNELKKEISSLAKEVLSDYEMEIFEMYFYSGLKAKEIAKKTGKDEKSINNAIYRIKSKLKGKNIGGT